MFCFHEWPLFWGLLLLMNILVAVFNLIMITEEYRKAYPETVHVGYGMEVTIDGGEEIYKINDVDIKIGRAHV